MVSDDVAIKQRSVRPAGWWFDALLIAAFVALTMALAAANEFLLDVDIAVRDWVDGHRPSLAGQLAALLNRLGQGGALTLLATALGGWLALRSRSWRPLLPPVAAFVLTTGTIGPLKYWLDRGFPHRDCMLGSPCETPYPVRFFSDPAQGTAYPSGHVANAIVWYAVIVLLLRALHEAYHRPPLTPVQDGLLTLMRVLPPVIVFCTTTYLGHHWITDSLAGLLLGLLIDRLLARAPWNDLPRPMAR